MKVQKKCKALSTRLHTSKPNVKTALNYLLHTQNMFSECSSTLVRKTLLPNIDKQNAEAVTKTPTTLGMPEAVEASLPSAKAFANAVVDDKENQQIDNSGNESDIVQSTAGTRDTKLPFVADVDVSKDIDCVNLALCQLEINQAVAHLAEEAQVEPDESGFETHPFPENTHYSLNPFIAVSKNFSHNLSTTTEQHKTGFVQLSNNVSLEAGTARDKPEIISCININPNTIDMIIPQHVKNDENENIVLARLFTNGRVTADESRESDNSTFEDPLDYAVPKPQKTDTPCLPELYAELTVQNPFMDATKKNTRRNIADFNVAQVVMTEPAESHTETLDYDSDFDDSEWPQFENEKQLDQNTDLNMSPDKLMDDFFLRAQQYIALPDYALSDSVFAVDQPVEAANKNQNIPAMEISAKLTDTIIEIFITEVYSPFQFWFNFDNQEFSRNTLHSEIQNFYNSLNKNGWEIPKCLAKPGHLCAARHQLAWLRSRIVRVNEKGKFTVFCVDSGIIANKELSELKFLHKDFIKLPAFAARGALSHVHYKGLHWSKQSTDYFTKLTESQLLYAIVSEVNEKERVANVMLCHNKDFIETVGKILIDAKCAFRSSNFSSEARRRFGRRLQYPRERLPSFDMLESQAFPSLATKETEQEEFEDFFDSIVYSSQFYDKFESPNLVNPFHAELKKALVQWLEQYKADELAFQQSIKNKLESRQNI